LYGCSFQVITHVFVVEAETLRIKGSLQPDAKYPYWPLRSSVQEAKRRATALFPKDSKPSQEEFETVKIELSTDGVCSLWPEFLSVEPGAEPYRFRLHGPLYLKYVTPECVLLYSAHMELEV
jgi:hypothetical protein